MVINLIYCDLPNAKAVSEESEDVDTHNIYINKNLPHERMREEIKHELSHIIRDDFYVDHHVNLVERIECLRLKMETLAESTFIIILFNIGRC